MNTLPLIWTRANGKLATTSQRGNSMSHTWNGMIGFLKSYQRFRKNLWCFRLTFLMIKKESELSKGGWIASPRCMD